MDSFSSRSGQGARLVVGRRRDGLISYDTSAFAELQRPARWPSDPVVPGGDLPVRTVTDVTKGLGLAFDAERDLGQAVQEWIKSSPNPVEFRSRVIKGLRSFAPDNYAMRNEIWRRAVELYRSTAPVVDRRPGRIVIQKSERPAGVSQDRLSSLIERYKARGDRIKGGKADKRNPEDFDRHQLALGVSIELEHTDDELMALEICCDHLAEDPRYYTHLTDMERKYKKSMLIPAKPRQAKEKTEAGAQRPESMRLKPQPEPKNIKPPPAKADEPIVVKSDDGWESMVGIDGGLRRSVPGGYEYRFPAADLTAAPVPEIGRVMRARPTINPPELLFCYDGDEDLDKAAGHKYLKRIPTGKQRPKWRYIYKLPSRRGLVVDEHLVAGAKFKVEHAGKVGHFEVLGHDKKGVVHVRHDESGKEAHIHHKDLARMLEAHHRRAGTAEAGAAGGSAAKLPRVKMTDLARGEWEEVVGFRTTEDEAVALAKTLKKGWDYAAIKQPSGFMVVAKRQRGTEPGQREIFGDKVKVKLRNEKDLDAVYTLVEADDLVASHNPLNFNVRKDYPAGVQERPYHTSKHEQGKVMRIAQELDPVFLINNNPDGVNGTPIVTQDNVVLGGNARSMGIQRAYQTEPANAKLYKNYLIAHARDYGFRAADVRNMKQPILVRRHKVNTRHAKFQTKKEIDQTKVTAHLRLLGRRMNEGMTQGMDPRAEEVALGQNFVNERMLRTMVDSIGEGQTLDAFMQSEASRDFIKSLWAAGVLDKMNAGQFTLGDDAGADKGLLNEEGRTRVERILVGKLIDSPQLLDRMSPTLRKSLAGSVLPIIIAQQSGWDIVPKLKRAIQIDQSIQRMEKELDAVGQPRVALRKFLEGKQAELPGVSGMVEEVRNDDTLRNLLIVVREKAGVDKMPRDFRGFALRAKEDAMRNPDITGQHDLFGGGPEEKQETSEEKQTRMAKQQADALDIEFGVTPPRAEEKRARRQAELQAKREAEAEKKRVKKQVAEMKAAQGGLFAASMEYDIDLSKGGDEGPNRLVTRAINHVEMLVDAAVSRSMQAHGEIRIDGAKIARVVMADLAEAVRKDPELAREQGRHPVDAKVVRGLVEAFAQIRGKDLLEKSMAVDLVKASASRPPGSGWLPPSGKRRVSWMKIVGGKKVYWSPSKGHHVEPRQTLFGDEEQPLPKPTTADLKEAARQVAESDEYRRAEKIADRLKRHGLDKLPGKYAQAVEHWDKHKAYQLALVRQVSDIEEVHKRQDTARIFAQRQGDLMREFELRQTTLFGDQPPEPEKRELEPAEVRSMAREAYSLGASKNQADFSRYMNNVVDKHGETQARLVMEQVKALQEARRGRVTASAPKPARPASSGSQASLFSGHQATQRGEQGVLFRSGKGRFITEDELRAYGRRMDVEDPGWRERQRAQMTADWLEDGIPLEKINAWFDGPRLKVRR